jgi:hypothetical protein
MASNSPKHTPGPWARTGCGQHVHIHAKSDSKAFKAVLIATVEDPKGESGNPALIAAAPDLLAALRHLVHQLEWHISNNADFGADRQRVREAKTIIARIEGEQ